MLETLITTLGIAVIGMFGWAFSINSDVRVLQERDKDYKELVTVQFQAVHQRLDRIERAMNGKLSGH